MYALVSLIVIVSLSLLIVRVGTVALTMTGLSKDVASFQSLSAFSGAGYTTEESETITAYPARRRVVTALIRLGSVGLVTTIASLVLSFTDPATQFERLAMLVGAVVVLVALSTSSRFQALVTPAIRWALSRTATFELRDYTGLLNLHGDYRVADIEVGTGEWLTDERIADLELSDEGVVILGIRREDGTYVGAPSGEDVIRPGDTLVTYGREDRLQELSSRLEGDDEAHRQAVEEHRDLLARERRIDPERQPGG